MFVWVYDANRTDRSLYVLPRSLPPQQETQCRGTTIHNLPGTGQAIKHSTAGISDTPSPAVLGGRQPVVTGTLVITPSLLQAVDAETEKGGCVRHAAEQMTSGTAESRLCDTLFF